MMVRVLSVLPGLVGLVCAVILIASLLGYSTDESETEIPIVPCSDDEAIGCQVGMTGGDLSVPNAFMLLDIELKAEWEEPERSWLAVVDAAAAIDCPPNSNGLTTCTEEDFEEYIVTGGSDADGSLVFEVGPGDYRFITAGKDGSTLGSQTVTLSTSVHLNDYFEIALAIVTVLLLAGAGEMAFPIRNLWKRFRDA
jgi:hypothetical protein